MTRKAKTTLLAAPLQRAKRRTLLLVGLLVPASFLLGVWAHSGYSRHTDPDPSRIEESVVVIAPPEPAVATAASGGRMIVPDYEPVSAIMVCSMMGPNFEAKLLVEMAKALHDKSRCIILINSTNQVERCRQLFAEAGLPPGSIELLRVGTNSIWLRDYAPIFVRESNGEVMAVESKYLRNADPTDTRMVTANDDFAVLLSNGLNLGIDSLPIFLEGGNVVANGAGLICTTSLVLSANQGRGFDARRLSKLFQRRFGENKWLMTPKLEGEPTGHADIFVTFLAKDKVVIGQMDPKTDPVNAKLLDDLAVAFRKNASGSLEVYRVPIVRDRDDWLSYCNVVVVNGTILVPSFSHAEKTIEARAMQTYREAMPEADVVAIPCDSLLRWDGLLHCITLTIPQGVDFRALGLVKCP